MTPLDRVRLEKAAVDCGFEMTPVERDGGLELRSAHFPEAVLVHKVGPTAFSVVAPGSLLPSETEGAEAVTVAGFASLYEFLRTAAAHARTLPNRVADAFRRETAGFPRSTETERMAVQRVGQNLFRAALLDYWQGRCCVTGLSVPSLLRASHIRPWARCATDEERLDVFNGLLLAPHVDALFDGGWISFSDSGAVLFSNALSEPARTALGVSVDWKIGAIKPAHASYLAFHRAYEFRNAANGETA